MTHSRCHAAQTPTKIAVIMSDGSDSIDYATLEVRANQAAQYFRSLGLKRGDTIAFWLPNCIAIFEIYFAAQRSGLYITPISAQLTASEAAYIVENSQAKLLLSSQKIVDFDRLDTGDGVTRLTLGEWADKLLEHPPTPIKDESAGTHMMYSSGTTGNPKGIRLPLPEGGITDNVIIIKMLEHDYAANIDDIYLSPAPLYHAAPLIFSTAMLRMGMTVVVMPKFDAEDVLRVMETYKVTMTQMVPTMFVRMLKLPDERRLSYDMSGLRVLIHAAAPCPNQIKHKMIDWLGPIIYEYYAGSEANGSTHITAQEWLERPGSVGRTRTGHLRICDDDGNELPVGEQGIIYFDCGHEFEYLGDDEKTSESRNPKHKSWTTLGDIGSVDAEGYLFLTDRRSYTIISGGVNIYPQEIENLLITHPRIMDAAVIGVPNADFGEEVKAIVQPLDDNDTSDEFAEELIAYCQGNLSRIKCPRSVDFDSELPRMENGKLYKRLIRDRYWQGHNAP